MHVPSKRKAGYEAVASEEDAPDAFVARITSEPRRRKPVERFEAASCTGMTRDLRKKEARLGGPAPSPRCTPRVWRPRPQLATPARALRHRRRRPWRRTPPPQAEDEARRLSLRMVLFTDGELRNCLLTIDNRWQDWAFAWQWEERKAALVAAQPEVRAAPPLARPTEGTPPPATPLPPPPATSAPPSRVARRSRTRRATAFSSRWTAARGVRCSCSSRARRSSGRC